MDGEQVRLVEQSKNNTIMKKIFFSIMAVAALAACNKADIVNVDPGEAIEFGNAFVDNATKAEDPTYGTVSLTKFQVYGTVKGTGNGVVNIFNGAEVNGSIGENAWTCGVKQYWIANATYNFAAVADATVETDGSGMPTTLTTVANATSNFKDMLYASEVATGKASGNDKVNFTFSHLLSKAQFTVTSNTEDDYYYSVKNINVTNYESGTYTISTQTWTPAEPNIVAFGNVEKVTKNNNNKTNATQMLLVPSETDFKVTFTVEIYKGETLLGTTDYEKDVTTDLVAGHAYNFTIALSVGELIEFTVTSNPTWDSSAGTVTVM